MTIQVKTEALDNYCRGRMCHDCIFEYLGCTWDTDEVVEKAYAKLIEETAQEAANEVLHSERVAEIQIKDTASLNSIVQALALNGYECQVSPVWKEFPYHGMDHYAVRIGKKVCE